MILMLSLRPNVLKMNPYSPGKPIDEVKRELGLTRVVKLASNENPLGPSPKAVEAVRDAALQLHLYPDGAAYNLREAIANHYGLPMHQIVVGNGSDEIIHLLGQILLGESSDEVIVGNPSFVRYDAAAGLADCKLVKVPLNSEQRIDLVAMAEAITANTKLIFIANPNNPTGTIVTQDELDAFLAKVPESVVVVLDEAYCEFAEGAFGYPNSLNYVNRFANVVGMRTFSKAYGLAGIRVGYAFVPDAIADAVDRAREPFNVNILAQVAAIAALQDREYVAETVRVNQDGLDRLEAVFTECGGTPYKSYANFVMADIGRPAQPVFQALLERGVITRSGHVLGMPNCLRVSVGTPNEISIFVEEFRAVMAPVAVG
jgi:histidinol-phosphate aminotransferase